MLFFCLIGTILVSCDKTSENSPYQNSVKSVQSDQLGAFHNEGLTYIIDNYNYTGNDEIEGFEEVNTLQKDFFDSKGYTPIELPSEINDLAKSGDGITWLRDLELANKISISQNLDSYLVSMLQYAYSGNTYTRIQVFTYFDNILANAVLSQSEYAILENCVSVGKYSFDYWFNADGTPKNYASRKPWNGGRTLGADLIGGLFGGAAGYLGASALDWYYQTCWE